MKTTLTKSVRIPFTRVFVTYSRKVAYTSSTMELELHDAWVEYMHNGWDAHCMDDEPMLSFYQFCTLTPAERAAL